MLEGKYIELTCTYPGYKLLSYEIIETRLEDRSYNSDGYCRKMIDDVLHIYIDYDVFNVRTYNFINKGELIAQIEKAENRKTILKSLIRKYNI